MSIIVPLSVLFGIIAASQKFGPLPVPMPRRDRHPYRLLYRDVVHSIFVFFTLDELIAASSMHRNWRDDAMMLHPRNDARRIPLSSILSSSSSSPNSLSHRHVRRVNIRPAGVTNERYNYRELIDDCVAITMRDMIGIRDAMLNLQLLRCSLDITSSFSFAMVTDPILIFPSSLHTLHI